MDVKRTRSDMNFFISPTKLTYNEILNQNIPPREFPRPYLTQFSEIFGRIDDDPYLNELMNNENIEKHADVMSRILFIYAKLNPGVRYVQGMNEILAPIYYCFA